MTGAEGGAAADGVPKRPTLDPYAEAALMPAPVEELSHAEAAGAGAVAGAAAGGAVTS